MPSNHSPPAARQLLPCGRSAGTARRLADIQSLLQVTSPQSSCTCVFTVSTRASPHSNITWSKTPIMILVNNTCTPAGSVMLNTWNHPRRRRWMRTTSNSSTQLLFWFWLQSISRKFIFNYFDKWIIIWSFSSKNDGSGLACLTTDIILDTLETVMHTVGSSVSIKSSNKTLTSI